VRFKNEVKFFNLHTISAHDLTNYGSNYFNDTAGKMFTLVSVILEIREEHFHKHQFIC